MSGTDVAENVDMSLEVVVISVSDADRAKEFYQRLGWRLDVDRLAADIRVIQFTPPGSGCSVQMGTNITSAAPGSSQAQLLIVSDVEAAHETLTRRGIEVNLFHCVTGAVCRFRGADADDRADGPSPRRASYGSYASFSDPDGNGWLLQEVTTRLPGRVDPAATSFGSAGALAGALQRASAAHDEHEKRIGAADPNWPDWYAAYMVAEQAGTAPPS